MTENKNQESSKTYLTKDEIFNAKTKEELDELQIKGDVRQEYEKDLKQITNELASKKQEEALLRLKLSRLEREKTLRDSENEALKLAIFEEKKQSSLSESERQESEGTKMSRMVFETILKRCREGQYSGRACRECAIQPQIVPTTNIR
jgi:isocitrate lyase